MVVADDRLYAGLCVDCVWGGYEDFEIDLRTNRATRVSVGDSDAPGPSDGDNPRLEDIANFLSF